ncbi:hypothetical protein PV08_06863 [Exophiala spinifera]|uniref:C2H2-type domain-containing protein n=1 Tax=Exophiala spinifera TaxID=91928 RepID=A0A0D1ZMP2_9EURO|nr:uncharacterized protein PV08_06863 [Exophiala spinifera]KIW14082.1 hypothetical protein PV08_06863 [Exophiala spinifera]
MAFTSASVDDFINPNFTLASTCASTRHRYPGQHDAVLPSGYLDSDDFMISSTSAMSYPSVTAPETSYPLSVTSSLSGYDADPAYDEFLTEDALSGNNFVDMNLVSSSQYPGQIQSQDIMNHGYVPSDLSSYSPGMLNNSYPTEMPLANGPLTPPPEEQVHQELFHQHYVSTQGFLEDPYQANEDSSLYRASATSKPTAYRSAHSVTMALRLANPLLRSIPKRIVIQPRPIRSALERDGTTSDSGSSSTDTRFSHEDPSGDKAKVRNNPLYDAKPDEDGYFRCPMVKEHQCKSHKPTKQKCIYNKYLDSHLRPYRCRFTDKPECEDARFSSNACLFRHEREAHGLHNHGFNPFLCKFLDCDRSREGNGFPRRWNQRDHMRRVHDYEEKETTKDRTTEQTKRRKTQGTPTSAAMKRSASSAYSKAQAMAGAAISSRYGRVNQARYNAPVMYSAQLQDPKMMSLGKVQYSTTIPDASQCLPSRSKAYPG